MSFILFVFVCLFARLFFFSCAVTVHLRTKQTVILSLELHSVTQSSTCKWGNLARNTQVQRKDFFFFFFVEEECVKQTFPLRMR